MIKNIKNFNIDIYDQLIKTDSKSENDDYYISNIFPHLGNVLKGNPLYQSEGACLFDSVGYRLLNGYESGESDNVLSNGISVSDKYLENKYFKLDNPLYFYLHDEQNNEYAVLTDKESISVVENRRFCINAIIDVHDVIRYAVLSINPSFRFLGDVYYCKTRLDNPDHIKNIDYQKCAQLLDDKVEYGLKNGNELVNK